MLGEKRRADCLRSNLQRKFGLAPTPLKAVQNPGWSAQRHRRGRAMQSIANGSAKFSVRSLTAFFLPQPPRRGGRPTPPPGGETQRSLRSLALPLASAEKLLRRCPCSAQRSTQTARLGDSFYFAKSEIVESLLRRGARVPLDTRKLELARQQEGTALTPGGRCLPALGRGLTGEKAENPPPSPNYSLSRESITIVTGPSLTSDTCISAPKRPVGTFRPISVPSRSTNVS